METARDHRIITSIYDVAMRPERWETVLDEIAHASGAGGAAVFVEDSTTSEFELSATSSIFTPEALAEYAAEYHADDAPAYARLMHFPARRMFTDHEIMDGHRDAATMPTRIWLRERLGMHHRSAARLHDEGVWFDVMVAQYRDDGAEFTPDRLLPINRFLPHVTKTLELSRTFEVLRRRFRAVLAALDRFHVGVMVLSSSLEVVVKNREGRRILELRDGLELDARSRPVATHVASGDPLRPALEHALRSKARPGCEAGTRLTVPRRSESTDFLVEICPFVDEGSEFESAFRGAYLLVVDPDDTRHVCTDGMQALYDLTNAETEVCRLLAQGLSTTDMADDRGVSPETLRTQVKRLLQKTGTQSRAHLVRRALLVNLPIDREEAAE
jgi:DNA-binding CsgD family transcriptional regulator